MNIALLDIESALESLSELESMKDVYEASLSELYTRHVREVLREAIAEYVDGETSLNYV